MRADILTSLPYSELWPWLLCVVVRLDSWNHDFLTVGSVPLSLMPVISFIQHLIKPEPSLFFSAGQWTLAASTWSGILALVFLIFSFPSWTISATAGLLLSVCCEHSFRGSLWEVWLLHNFLICIPSLPPPPAKNAARSWKTLREKSAMWLYGYWLNIQVLLSY